MNESIHSVSEAQSSGFLEKVFLFFGLAILISAVGVFFGLTVMMGLIMKVPFLIWIVFGAELILIFTSRMWSTIRPLNYLLFSLFAFLSGITLVPLIAVFAVEFGGYDMIIKSLVATTLMFTATALFARTTTRKFDGLGGFLFMGLIGMLVVGLIGVFFPWSNTFEMMYAGFGTLLFAGFVLHDIQQIEKFPADRAIDVALMLYLDIFNLFVSILRLMGALRRD